jgi:oligosaccharide reducing-end xylanase
MMRLTPQALAAFAAGACLACGSAGAQPSPTPTAAPTTSPTPSATPAASSVWQSGHYRNLFAELGHSDAEIEAKVAGAVDAFFHGDETLRCYYPVGSDEAYVLDSGNNDIRSEGMSYGMLIAVQAGLRTEFDRLWNYASRRMRHASGDRQGYFAWHLSPAGVVLDANSASDGEEYFATALYFAWKRWGDSAYKAAADDILLHMLHQDRYVGAGSTVTRMIDPTTKLIVFVPEGQGATFTDPSYHLPAFYELFARWANADNAYWTEVAQASRTYLPTAAHATTGLFPDYSLFDGRPTDPWNGGHADFRMDAWRVMQNIALDSYWFGLDPWQVAAVDRLQGFFAGQGVATYGNTFTLAGTQTSADHSPGLVAMNAVGSLVASNARARDFVQELWSIQPTRGRWRYYDGCLYVLGLLHCSGRYQIIGRPE